MKRKIVAFVPNKKFYIQELNILLQNFKHLKLEDSETGMLLFGPAKVINSIVQTKGLDLEVTEDSLEPDLKYEFINSLSLFKHYRFDDKSIYDNQVFLKTDTDVFLTPNFINWYPEGKFITGMGGYCTQEVKAKIKEVAEELGLRHRGIHNIGATWYGDAKDIIEVGRLAADITRYILIKHFKERKFNWPNWTYGVASMYGSEIAINHLVAEKLIIDGSKLDGHSDSEESIDNAYHIHCWRTDKRYSKFWFRDGKYDGIKKETLNPSIIHDYCLSIALDSKKTGLP